MRQYQPIWERIKEHKTATLIAPAESHLKIARAVHKERWKDIGFKLLLSEAEVCMTLEVDSDKKKNALTFTLITKQVILIKDL